MPAIEFQYDIDKTREALAYLASNFPRGMEKYAACKLLFLADKYHLVRYGRTITGDRYAAMPLGPVPSKTLDLLNFFLQAPEAVPELAPFFEVDNSFRYPRFVLRQLPGRENLSQSDLEALDEILRRYGSKDFGQLKVLTHSMVAYKRAWEQRGTRESVVMAFEDFFEEDEDAVAGVMEEAIENSELRKVFGDHEAV